MHKNKTCCTSSKPDEKAQYLATILRDDGRVYLRTILLVTSIWCSIKSAVKRGVQKNTSPKRDETMGYVCAESCCSSALFQQLESSISLKRRLFLALCCCGALWCMAAHLASNKFVQNNRLGRHRAAILYCCYSLAKNDCISE